MSETFDCEIYCPHCAQRVELQIGLGQKRLLIAISLQAERFGTEIDCSHCGVGFIYTRIRRQQPEQKQPEKIGRPHFDLAPKGVPTERTTAPAPENIA